MTLFVKGTFDISKRIDSNTMIGLTVLNMMLKRLKKWYMILLYVDYIIQTSEFYLMMTIKILKIKKPKKLQLCVTEKHIRPSFFFIVDLATEFKKNKSNFSDKKKKNVYKKKANVLLWCLIFMNKYKITSDDQIE